MILASHVDFFLICLPFVIRTTKRPVPLEHCLFYSGELYKVCENEQFVPQGFKAAKDVFKKKNTSSAFGGSGAFHGSSSAANDRSRGQRRDNFSQGKHPKGSQTSGNVGTGWGNKNSVVGQNVMGLRRSEASLWLSLINKLSKKSLLPVSANLSFNKYSSILPCKLVSSTLTHKYDILPRPHSLFSWSILLDLGLSFYVLYI